MNTYDELKQSADQKFDALNQSIKDKGPTGILPYASLLNSTLNGFRAATNTTIAAGMAGKSWAVAGGVVDIIGSLMPLASIAAKFGGPAGTALFSLVAGFFDILGSVLAGVEPARKSIKDELQEVIDRYDADSQVHIVGAANESFRVAIGLLMLDHGNKTWEELQATINLAEGNAVTALNQVAEWLGDKTDNPEWKDVFEVYWNGASLRSQLLALVLPRLQSGEATEKGLFVNEHQLSTDKAFAEKIRERALDAGIFWHLGDNSKLYRREDLSGDTAWSAQMEVGETRKLTIGSGGMLYGLENGHVWVGQASNRCNVGAADFCILPLQLTSMSPGRGNTTRYDDALFLLDNEGATVRWSIVPDYLRTTTGESIDVRNWQAVKLTGPKVRKLMALPGGEHPTANGSVKQILFYFLCNENDGGPDVLCNVPNYIIRSPNTPYALESGARYGDKPTIGMTASSTWLYVYGEEHIYCISMRTGELEETISLPSGAGLIRSVETSEDGQLLVVAGEELWKSDHHKDWKQVPDVQARWAAKQIAPGAEIMCRFGCYEAQTVAR